MRRSASATDLNGILSLAAFASSSYKHAWVLLLRHKTFFFIESWICLIWSKRMVRSSWNFFCSDLTSSMRARIVVLAAWNFCFSGVVAESWSRSPFYIIRIKCNGRSTLRPPFFSSDFQSFRLVCSRTSYMFLDWDEEVSITDQFRSQWLFFQEGLRQMVPWCWGQWRWTKIGTLGWGRRRLIG